MPMPKKKTPKIVKVEPTQAELKKAYQLVTKDLFNKLVKAKNKDKVTIGAMGSLGSFHKNERKVKSGIAPKGTKSKGLSTYVYYSVRFKPARKLKTELNKALDKKYNK